MANCSLYNSAICALLLSVHLVALGNAQQYTIDASTTGAPPNWKPSPGSSPLVEYNSTQSFTLPFEFFYFGTPYQSVNVSNYGGLFFSPKDGCAEQTNLCVASDGPGAQRARNAIIGMSGTNSSFVGVYTIRTNPTMLLVSWTGTSVAFSILLRPPSFIAFVFDSPPSNIALVAYSGLIGPQGLRAPANAILPSIAASEYPSTNISATNFHAVPVPRSLLAPTNDGLASIVYFTALGSHLCVTPTVFNQTGSDATNPLLSITSNADASAYVGGFYGNAASLSNTSTSTITPEQAARSVLASIVDVIPAFSAPNLLPSPSLKCYFTQSFTVEAQEVLTTASYNADLQLFTCTVPSGLNHGDPKVTLPSVKVRLRVVPSNARMAAVIPFYDLYSAPSASSYKSEDVQLDAATITVHPALLDPANPPAPLSGVQSTFCSACKSTRWGMLATSLGAYAAVVKPETWAEATSYGNGTDACYVDCNSERGAKALAYRDSCGVCCGGSTNVSANSRLVCARCYGNDQEANTARGVPCVWFAEGTPRMPDGVRILDTYLSLEPVARLKEVVLGFAVAVFVIAVGYVACQKTR